MGFFVRAFAVLNSVREWFTFANDAFSWFGVAKRAAAVTAVAATVAAPVVLVSKSAAPVVAQAGQPGQPGQAPQPVAQSDVEDGLEKISPNNLYSKAYLRRPEHRALLEAIVAKCEADNDLPAAQCDIADSILKSVKHREYLAELRRESEARDKAFREGLKQPSTGPGPTEIKMFKD